MPRRNPPSSSAPRAASLSTREVVDPIWLVKALAAAFAAALFCGYLALCLLFYQGQWQLVLHPSPSPNALPSPPCQLFRFALDETATPQLTGCLIPAQEGGRYAAFTILYLRGGDGSLADSLPSLESLHGLGINLFAIDYRGFGRGFGQSGSIRPSQQTMTEDAAQAWNFLVSSRGVPASSILLYGTGVGASLAADLAALHRDAPALILDQPVGDLLDVARADPRSRLLPVAWLFHDRFPLAERLRSLATPKLLISSNGSRVPAVFETAADPKLTVELARPDPSQRNLSIARFLDQYLTVSSVPRLTPSAVPAAQRGFRKVESKALGK